MSHFWAVLFSNYILNVGVLSWFLAQLIKTVHTFVKYKEIRLERLVGAGGMPSSHSALVCSVTLAMAKVEGFSSPIFALTFAFSAVVMYDAMGVRRAAGEQAKVINKMIFSFKDLDKLFEVLGKEIEREFERENFKESLDESTGHIESVADHIALKEFIGHTPLEVLGGALLGILVASLMPYAK